MSPGGVEPGGVDEPGGADEPGVPSGGVLVEPRVPLDPPLPQPTATTAPPSAFKNRRRESPMNRVSTRAPPTATVNAGS